MSKIYLWNLLNKLDIQCEIQDKIKRITNCGNHLYVLTHANVLFHGTIKDNEDREEIYLTKQDGMLLKDIDSAEEFLYGVDLNGRVFKYTENLICIKEIMLIEDAKPCSHGNTGTKFKMKVDKISVGVYGILFITESGQLWASGNMHQIGINSETPKRVTFFEDRIVYSANVGNDFAIAIVSKQYTNEDFILSTYDDEILSSTCPHCTTSRLASPASQNSCSESCPLGKQSDIFIYFLNP